ncbi:MAG: HAD family hydrolase [Deltaproteobacteria bacterium]|nr:HAD family hydrolase [Deltaproteobacteria bacterium]
MVDAVIFDVDGTLVDSLDLLAQAWGEALARVGRLVSLHAIRARLAEEGVEPAAAFLDAPEHARLAAHLEALRAEHFRREGLSRVQPFPRVRPLFQALAARGVRRALASPGRRDELEHHVRLCNLTGLVDAQVAQPEHGARGGEGEHFRAALDHLGGLSPERVAVATGALGDVAAAHRAGLRCVGFTCGGASEEALRNAGADAVYSGPGDLLDHLETSPLVDGARISSG